MKKLALCFVLLSISLLMAGAGPCRAEQGGSFLGNLKEAGKEAGKDFKKAGKEIKEAGKETSQKLGEAGKEISRDVKKKVKKADRDAEKGFGRTMKEIRANASKSWNDFRRVMGWD